MESTKETEPDAKVPETSEKKLLKDLKVADLKSELESRGQVTSGVKAVLLERLKGILVEEGHDPLVFDFNAPKVEVETKVESPKDTIEESQPEIEAVEENNDQPNKLEDSEKSIKDDAMETEEVIEESKIDDSKADFVEENIETKDDTKEESVEITEKSAEITEKSVEITEKSVEKNTENEADKVEESKEDVMEAETVEENDAKDAKLNNGSSGPVVRCILPPMDDLEMGDNDDLEDDTLTVTGVVFQFNANSILFEFSAKEGDEEESIGEIKPSNLILSSTGKSIPRDTKEEDIANYVQAGDKLSCRVVKSMSMRSFSYVEEEEEIGEDGEEKRTSRTVEIKPQWIAISGETLVQASETPKGLRKEDVNVLEDQLEDLFDYEPEEDEDEDIVLIEEVKIDDDDTASVKDKPVKDKSVKDKPTKDKSVKDKPVKDKPVNDKPVKDKPVKDKPVNDKPVKDKPVNDKPVKDKEMSVEPMTNDNPVDPVDVTYKYKAKILQLRRPASGDQGKSLKVSSCSMELLEGKHAGQTVNAISMSMYMWGYNLSKANLNYVLKYGDVCQVEYKIQPKENHDFDFDLLLVKKVWIGPQIGNVQL